MSTRAVDHLPMEKLTTEGGVVEEKKKLYVFLYHNFGVPSIHTFYEVPIPNPNDDPSPSGTEDRELHHPIVSFSLEKHGRDMCCANLGSKFYFIGGTSRDLRDASPIYRNDVYCVDVAANAPYELIKSPSMNSAKIGAVAFATEGKIFVLLCKTTTDYEPLHPFEMFTPDRGRWDILPSPPFIHHVAAHVVVNPKVYVYCCGGRTLFIFDLAAKAWDKAVEEPSFGFGFGTLVLEDKMYTCSNRFAPSLLSHVLDLSGGGDDDRVVPLCLRWNVLSVVNGFKSWFPSTYVVSVGNGQFCFLQVGCPPDPDDETDMALHHPSKCLMNLTLFDSSTDQILSRGSFTLDSYHVPTFVKADAAIYHIPPARVA